MSKFYDRADSIKAVIDALPEVAGVAVLVYRQKILQTELDVSLAKVGGAIIITWDGGNQTDPLANLQIISNYTIEVVANPLVAKNQYFCDDIIQAVMKALHGWNPTPSLGCDYDAQVDGPTPVADPDYLVFQITCQIPINL